MKFVKLLRELFELDKSDLDFGIYRILNIRNKEVDNFLENTLSKEVNEILSNFSIDNTAVQSRIKEIEEQCADLGVEIESTKLYDEYQRCRNQLSAGMGLAELENDVYSALYKFFNRYYDEGDFISKRRYKEGVYAIPYEGEEVKLYWANNDQYYIKTSENFQDYSFNLNSQEEKYSIHFRLVEATTETNNNKENDEKKREFILVDTDFIEYENNNLFVKFEYRVATNEDEQNRLKHKKKINIQVIDKINNELKKNEESKKFILPLNAPANRNSKSKDITIIEKHINTYVAKNTFDYFIHKDLEGFLNRELDFYIKSEIMHLDDLDTDKEVKVETYLAKLKTIKKIGRIVIKFLAQIENFQKKLWTKKKFVVDTSWCITLDRIDQEFYQEIATNEKQIDEWINLYAIDEILGDTITEAFSKPLTLEFLQQNQNLLIDTKHFSEEFKERVIARIENLDETTNGLLIHSDNYQALNFLQNRYEGEVDCVHIDPPYNTDTSGFLYKNNYKHSSWASMMFDRIELANKLLDKETGSFLTHIDENEYELLFNLFEMTNIPNANTIIWDKLNPMLGRKGVATQHEYIVFRSFINRSIYAKSENIPIMLEKAKKAIDNNRGVNDLSRKEYSDWVRDNKDLTGGDKQYRYIDNEGVIYRLVAMGAPEKRTDPKYFIPLIHPKTNKPCPIPNTGWSRTPATMKKMIEDKILIFGADETTIPQKKVTLTAETQRQISSVIANGSSGKASLDKLGYEFPYAHPVSLYEKLVSSNNSNLILDFFAGSGTTGHAVIELNRETEKNSRKYILVEMGEYFNTVTKPRMKKVVYSQNWKKGKPIDRNTGISQIIKSIHLESYEDVLNNIELKRSNEQSNQLNFDEDLFNEYLVSYMLDIESMESLLSINKFNTPFSNNMNISIDNNAKERKIDLIETFNYLLGVKVIKQERIQTFSARTLKNGSYEDAVELIEDEHGEFSFKAVEGMLPTGESALIIWRNITDDLTLTNAALDTFFKRYKETMKNREVDIVYINGDNNLEILKESTETWNTEVIDFEFKRRMFGEL